MKKILLFLALLMLTSPVFAAVGINVNGTTVGTAGNLYVNCPTGSTPYIDGFNYNVTTCSSTLVSDGTYNGGYVSLGTQDSGITLTNVLIKKAISNLGTTSDTLPNGTPNQMVTIEVVSDTGSGTWTINPNQNQSTGWTGISFTGAPQLVTLLYVNTMIGWIILSSDGSASSAAPTITDAQGT